MGIHDSSSRFMHRLAADDRADDLNVFDFVRLHVVRVVRQHHEIRELAGGDRAFDGFLARGVRAVQRIDAMASSTVTR
jgi:hypothetical protein